MNTYVRTILIALLLISTAFAQWSEPIQISPPLGFTDPRAVSVGETLHVVATKLTSFYYFRSTDNGDTWLEPVTPADSFYGGSDQPDIIYSNGKLHLVWIGEIQYLRGQIFHMSSTDGGLTWGTRHRVFNNYSSMLKYPRMAAKGDTLFFACHTSGMLLTFRSLNAGVTWQDSVAVEDGQMAIDQWEYILYSQGRVHLIYSMDWGHDLMGYEIYYRQSTNYGRTWSDRCILSTADSLPYRDSFLPSAYADVNGNIIVIWEDYKYGSTCGFNGEILGRISTDNGTSWLPEFALTDHETGAGSSCCILAGRPYVLWEDDSYISCACNKLVACKSPEYPYYWSQSFPISGPDTADERGPILFYSAFNGDTTLHCVVRRTSPGECALYYMKSDDITGIPLEGKAPVAEHIWLEAYPNPFNATVTISLSNHDKFHLAIFDITGRQITTLHTEQGNAIWDASGYSSGVYFAQVQAGEKAQSIKLILLK
jgi:hypothetical protein